MTSPQFDSEHPLDPQAQLPLSTSPVEEDARLTAFLRQHRLSAPAASPELEDKIMQAVITSELFSESRSTAHKRWPRSWWRSPWLPAAMVAGVLLAWGSQSWHQSHPTAAELAQLQNFLESGWDSTVSNSRYEEALYP